MFQKQTPSRKTRGFCVATLVVVLFCAGLAGLAYNQNKNDYATALENYRARSHHNALQTQNRIESNFHAIYENIRTISKLPSVREIDRHGETLSQNDRITIQEIYNNLASQSAISEVYILPENFNPEATDIATGKPEEPVIVFDHLIVGRTADASSKKEEPSSAEEIEIHEYRLMAEQLAWFKRNHPQENLSMVVPAISGREVITCDNSRYSPSKPNDADRSGFVYSVPFYGSDGKLRGMVSAISLTHSLKELFSGGDYALINSTYNQLIMPDTPSKTLKAAQEWIKKESPDPRLLYSETINLKTIDGKSSWVLWSGLPNESFTATIGKNITKTLYIEWAAIFFIGTSALAILIMGRKRQKAFKSAKEDAEAISSSIFENTVDGLIVINETGIIESLNSAAERIFGYSRKELIGKNLNVLMPEPYHSEHDGYLANYTSSGKAKIIGIGREVSGKRKDGSIFPIDLAVSEIKLDGKRIFSGFVRDISARKIEEEKLRLSEERFQLAIEGSNDGIWDWQDLSKNEVYWSPQFKKLLGYEEHEIASGYSEFFSMVHPEDAERLKQEVTLTLDQGVPFNTEYRLKLKSGEYSWFGAKAALVRDKNGKPTRMLGSLRNINESRQVEEMLRKSQERFQLATTGSNNGIWDWNMMTGEVYFSPRFKELLGYAENELPDSFEEWSERLHPEDKEPTLELLQSHLMVQDKGSYDVEYRLKTKSGEYKWFRTKGQAIWSEEGKPIRMAGSLSDISKRKGVEIELVAARKDAEIAARLKAEFLANMSHEIRTPMNGIIGMTNLLLDCDLRPMERGYAQTVINSAESLLQIINDILDFSKIEAGKIDLENIPFDLQSLMEEVCEMMAFKANEKNLEILLRYPPQIPHYVIGDPGRVRQILFNLTGNAVKFTESGHVLLTLKQEKAPEGKLKFRIEIEDTGIGIQADKLDHVFQKFSQADSSTTRKFGGTGLGLSICRELAHIMGGEIGVTSTYGVGSTFWFSVVLEEDKQGSSPLVIPENSQLEGARVLIVDDNLTARNIVREHLSPYGVVISEASGSSEALKILEKETFDAATVDFLMPEMDGAEFGRMLKENPSTRNMALIMITSAPSRGDKERMEKIGFSGYFSKPILHWQLRDALSAIIEARRSGKTIPIVTQHNLREAKKEKKRLNNSGLRFQNTHTLLAEDNPVNQQVATAMLEKYGIRVTPAANGDEAIKQIKLHHFDLIFMDCQMPVMDGYEATKTIRKIEERHRLPRIPIIAFTANALKGDDDKCFSAGMDDYIPKPVRQADLERVMTKWISESKRVEIIEPQAAATVEPQPESPPSSSLDISTFNSFREIMGERANDVLKQYISVSKGYIDTIASSLELSDFSSLSKAAHPLKSSSQQVGALKLGDIAKELEHLTKDLAPDPAVLQTLIEQAKKTQSETERAILSELRNSDKAA